jgi:chromosome segregation ATPase
MSDYSSTLVTLREARAQRDQSRDDLYKLLVQQLKLLRAQKRFDRGEIPAYPKTQAVIVEARRSLNEIDAQVYKTEAELRSWQQKSQDLREELDLLKTLLEQSQPLQTAMARINEGLDTPNLSEDEKAKLIARQEELLKRAKWLEKRIQAIREKIADMQKELSEGEQQRAQLQHDLTHLQQERQQGMGRTILVVSRSRSLISGANWPGGRS